MSNYSKKIFMTSNAQCPLRGLDASRLERYFRINGCRMVKRPEKADYIIFIGCAFENTGVDQCKRSIRALDKYAGELIVLGCFSETSPKEIRQVFKGKSLSSRMLNDVDRFFPEFRIKFGELPDANQPIFYNADNITDGQRSFFSRIKDRILALRAGAQDVHGKGYAYLRISWGCLGNCTYCARKKATGRLRSKPLNVCLDEYTELLRNGKRKFIITATDVGAYGLDIGSSFGELLEKMYDLSKDLNVEWYLMDLNVSWTVRYADVLEKMIRQGVISRLECPIQSGSERILRLMNRYNDVSTMEKVFRRFKEASPRVCLETHVIVGFPTESEEDFEQTLRVLKRVDFTTILPFPYGDLEGTVSSQMKQKIPECTIKKRLEEAYKLIWELQEKQV